MPSRYTFNGSKPALNFQLLIYFGIETHFCRCIMYLCSTYLGMPGFDSRVNGYVSMPSHVTSLVNPGCEQ